MSKVYAQGKYAGQQHMANMWQKYEEDTRIID